MSRISKTLERRYGSQDAIYGQAISKKGFWFKIPAKERRGRHSGHQFQTGGIRWYFKELKAMSNTDIGPKDFFEIACIKLKEDIEMNMLDPRSCFDAIQFWMSNDERYYGGGVSSSDIARWDRAMLEGFCDSKKEESQGFEGIRRLFDRENENVVRIASDSQDKIDDNAQGKAETESEDKGGCFFSDLLDGVQEMGNYTEKRKEFSELWSEGKYAEALEMRSQLDPTATYNECLNAAMGAIEFQTSIPGPTKVTVVTNGINVLSDVQEEIMGQTWEERTQEMLDNVSSKNDDDEMTAEEISKIDNELEDFFDEIDSAEEEIRGSEAETDDSLW